MTFGPYDFSLFVQSESIIGIQKSENCNVVEIKIAKIQSIAIGLGDALQSNFFQCRYRLVSGVTRHETLLLLQVPRESTFLAFNSVPWNDA